MIMFKSKLAAVLVLAMAPMTALAVSPKVADACYVCAGQWPQPATCSNQPGTSGWGACTSDGARCYFSAPGCIG